MERIRSVIEKVSAENSMGQPTPLLHADKAVTAKNNSRIFPVKRTFFILQKNLLKNRNINEEIKFIKNGSKEAIILQA